MCVWAVRHGQPMVMGFFQGGRAVLDCPLLCHLATTTRITYDAAVPSVMVCSMVANNVHNWMRNSFALVYAAASQPGVDSLVYFGRGVMLAGYGDA